MLDASRVPFCAGSRAARPISINGSARSLDEVVDFYDKRFKIGFTSREKRDLVAFLNTL
jgi:hypothetical protein